MSYIDKLGWIHIVDKRVLSARSHNTDVYYIPGGKRDPGETDQEALCREISEEVSVTLLPETLNLLGQFEAPAHGKPDGVLVRMTCYTADYEGTLAPSSEIAEISWLSYAERNKGSMLYTMILDWLKERELID